MAQLDVCLAGDQKVAGSSPAGSAAFFHGFKTGSCQFLVEKCAKY